ncbi:MAG: CDP-diacylglycerol--serine O-phosphatidyltransferase [Bacteroidetes bacterium GWF2_41_31]|nr:MAG: CDP-diacylglycerol--serine O-phosphatidyltransferase [Bacteroidetes bacterium GWF2_41_31]OFZ07986.1 MAG: CDP-diacylglycerol--serine O-phosphatidyltransferase [Bacteroidetes bacterium RIFOXYB12_FULL_41_6]
MKNYIPNTITLFNLLSGVLSIFYAMSGQLDMAAWFIFAAALFDFLDGFAARLLHAKSAIGGQLDSLADVVSFGVAPGFILFQMIDMSHGQPMHTTESFTILPFLAFIVPAFGALRLARFNVDDNQTDSFKGLPIPACGIFIASLPLIRTELYEERELFYMMITNTYFLIAIGVVLSFLMVSNFPMFGLKFKNFTLKDNLIKYFFLAVSLVLLILLQVVAIPFIIILYLFLSLILYLTEIQG